MEEGSNARMVTITGSPSQTQSAHVYVTKRLETPSQAAPLPRGGGSGSGRRGGRGGDR